MLVTTKNPEETVDLAKVLSAYLQAADVLCLHGDLGAGKTQFAKGIASGLGVTEHVTSPTFTLINEYQGRLPFYHIDAYRLEDPDEGYELGLEEYLYGGGVTLIEWPSKISDLLPGEYLEIVIEKDSLEDDYRTIRFTGYGERYASLVQELTKNVCVSNR